MRMNEYVAVSNAFRSAFRSMLNRLIDADIITGEFPSEDRIEVAEDQCWNELCLAFEEAGLHFDQVPE